MSDAILPLAMPMGPRGSAQNSRSAGPVEAAGLWSRRQMPRTCPRCGGGVCRTRRRPI